MSRNTRSGLQALRLDTKQPIRERKSTVREQASLPTRHRGRQQKVRSNVSDYEEDQIPPADPSAPPPVPNPPPPASNVSSPEPSPDRSSGRRRQRQRDSREVPKAKDDRFYPLWNKFSRKPPAPKLPGRPPPAVPISASASPPPVRPHPSHQQLLCCHVHAHQHPEWHVF